MIVQPPWVERLVGSDEPAARWVALTEIERRPHSDPVVTETRRQVLGDPHTRDLLDRLVPWEIENRISGHPAPSFAPNLLRQLFDIGVRPGDDGRIDACLDAMTRHVDDRGRLQSLGSYRGRTGWSSLPCDHHAILETLIRGGRGADPVVQAGIEVMSAALAETPQGAGWRCVPDPAVGFRGPGRKADVCPQVTLQALRVYALLPHEARPAGLDAATRTPLEVWRRRGNEQPYMFGHGRSFKEGKWPPTWYSALEVVATLGRFPRTWAAPAADPADTQAMAEIGACVTAYVLDGDGQVIPKSAYRGFAEHSFGRKGHQSDVATALVLRALVRLEPIAEHVEAVDVLALPGSKGSVGRPRPPR
ncbi:MAG: hypothetical protein V9G19_13070 [Tetrasphaera sp.]